MPRHGVRQRLLADILAGVSDALTRDYIRHYQEGRWDGRPLELRRPPLHAAEYGRYWSKHYEERRKPKKPSGPAKPPQHTQHPQQKPGPQAGRNPPKGPGHDNGRHEGRKNDGRLDNWDGPR